MRIFLSILMMGLSLMAVDKFSIEVLSVEDKSEISDTFMEKINELDLPFTTHHTEGNYRVLLGDFVSVEEAKKVLPRVKEQINEKAFITTGMAVVAINPKEKMIKAMIMAQARALKVSKDETMEVKGPQEEMRSEERETVVVKEEQEEVFCTSTKKALREAQIAKAIAFYKNSSYYSFSN